MGNKLNRTFLKTNKPTHTLVESNRINKRFFTGMYCIPNKFTRRISRFKVIFVYQIYLLIGLNREKRAVCVSVVPLKLEVFQLKKKKCQSEYIKVVQSIHHFHKWTWPQIDYKK